MAEMISRSDQVEALFHAAVELDGAAQRAFLENACGEDFELRREVEALLALDRRADTGLDRPASESLDLGGSPTSLLVGRRLGPYLLRRCIAAGGMGSVYEATQASPGRTVAVKVLRADLASAELEGRFQVEASLLARLQHPNIAHVYEAGVADLDGLRVPYIAMELIDGARTITNHAAAVGLDQRRRVELLVRVCDAVHHGHLRGVIHRDLKPANILVDSDGRPKLIDFGVARAIDPDAATRLTQAGVVIGTVQYMSPEQFTDARELDLRSDVYSLGVVLYELLCERLPHDLDGVPLPEAARIVREQEPRRPSTVVRTLRGDAETILLTALERDRSRRYQSAAALAEDLGRFLRGEPIIARAPSVQHRLALFARRHRALVGALAAITGVSLIAAVVSLNFAWREKRSRQSEELQSYLAHIAAADLSLRVHDSSGARRHLGATRLEQRGWEWRHLWGRLELAERTLATPLERCDAVAWASGRIAARCWDMLAPNQRAVVVWDAATGTELGRIGPEVQAPDCMALASDGSMVWSARDGALYLWDPARGTRELFDAGRGVPVTRLCTADPDSVAALLADGSVRVWNAAGARSWEHSPVNGAQVTSLALAPIGGLVALGLEDGSIRLERTDVEGDARVLSGHARAVLSVAFDSGVATLASGARDGTVCLWDLSTDAVLRRMYGHESEVTAVAYLECGTLLASASHDRTVRVWEVASGATLAVLHGHEAWIRALAASDEGDRLASGADDGTVRIWSSRAGAASRSLTPHTAIVRDVAFSPDGKRIASAGFDGNATLVDASTGAVVATLAGHRGRVQSIAFDPTSERVATGANDHLVRLWDMRSGALLSELAGHTDGVHAVAYSPDGQRLASGSKDRRVLVFDTASLATLAEFGHSDWLEGVTFDRSGSRLATVSRDGHLRLWSLPDARELWSQRLDSGLADVAVSPDGAVLATAGHDGVVRLWRLDRGAQVAALVGHSSAVRGLAFSPEGSRLASAGEDASVRLWDPASASEVLVLRGHASWVQCAAFSPDGTRLVSGGGNYDGTGVELRIWDALPTRE